ncbi:SusD/RagB family nutrient-binding outer membrane lipoprotein [Bacteroides uniformis]|nr:SusD/RagB family nutrient-binding outer membrane lipoprotein [Bacteroides uniformis]
MFSGYFMDPIPKFMKSNACYNFELGAGPMPHGNVLTDMSTRRCRRQKKNFYGNDNLKGYLGITEILKVELMHRIADTYGPLVYHQLGETPRVYGLQEAYTRFFADLDEGQQLIREYLDEGGDNNKFKEYDMLTNGKTLKEWLKFANSLRLRLAMRISNVDATLAKRPSNQSTE